MAIKGNCAFPKAPGLLESHHQIVYRHNRTHVGGVLPIGRDAVGVFNRAQADWATRFLDRDRLINASGEAGSDDCTKIEENKLDHRRKCSGSQDKDERKKTFWNARTSSVNLPRWPTWRLHWVSYCKLIPVELYRWQFLLRRAKFIAWGLRHPKRRMQRRSNIFLVTDTYALIFAWPPTIKGLHDKSDLVESRINTLIKELNEYVEY